MTLVYNCALAQDNTSSTTYEHPFVWFVLDNPQLTQNLKIFHHVSPDPSEYQELILLHECEQLSVFSFQHESLLSTGEKNAI